MNTSFQAIFVYQSSAVVMHPQMLLPLSQLSRRRYGAGSFRVYPKRTDPGRVAALAVPVFSEHTQTEPTTAAPGSPALSVSSGHTQKLEYSGSFEDAKPFAIA